MTGEWKTGWGEGSQGNTGKVKEKIRWGKEGKEIQER